MSQNNTPIFITEADLREHAGLRDGGELFFAPGTRFTPAASQLLSDKHITVRWRNEDGQIFVESDKGGQWESVHPLKNNNVRPKNGCMLCHSELTSKPALLTHLDDTTLVPKTHPRITLRGKLDSCICYCVLLQSEITGVPSTLSGFIADIRSYLGQVLQCEVTGAELPLPALGEYSSEQVHRWSHQPLKYLGHDHLLPDVTFGPNVARMNYLRAMVRELELLSCSVYMDSMMQVQREDMVAGLNRLSSAIYVVMILLLQCERGQSQVLEGLGHEPA